MKNDKTLHQQIKWLKENVIPVKTVIANNDLEDLKPLNDIIGDSIIVSLGECTHGTKEIFQMKHRLIEYLVIEKDFDIFAIEAAMPEAYKLNDFVLNGIGDPKELISGMVFWCWNTYEVLDMVLWMREFNQKNQRKIKFTGFDMQSIDGALQNLRDFANKNDIELIPSLDKIAKTDQLKQNSIKETFDLYTFKIQSLKTDSEKLDLMKEMHGLPEFISQELLNGCGNVYKHIYNNKDKYLKIISSYEYEWLLQNANIIVQNSNDSINSFDDSNKFRDKCMAENIKWTLDNNPESKIIVWAHNGHVNKKDGWLGDYLDDLYGKSMLVFGFFVGHGTYTAMDNNQKLNSDNILETSVEESLEYYFQDIDIPIFILDLENVNLNTPYSNWLLEENLVRDIGAVAFKDQFCREKITELYNLIVYINDTNGSQLLRK